MYEQIVKDGLKPKLDEGNRPQFFFLNNDAKACFTADGGLGMAVYGWRPEFADANEVGIELEEWSKSDFPRRHLLLKEKI